MKKLVTLFLVLAFGVLTLPSLPVISQARVGDSAQDRNRPEGKSLPLAAPDSPHAIILPKQLSR